MLYLTHDHVHAELTNMLILKGVKTNYVLPNQMEMIMAEDGGNNKILHISNPVSDRLYNIEKYKNDNLIIYRPGNNINGNWKQCLSTYIHDFAYLHTIQCMLNDNEYMLKYVEYMSNNKYKDIKGNVQYTTFIKDTLKLLNIQL